MESNIFSSQDHINLTYKQKDDELIISLNSDGNLFASNIEMIFSPGELNLDELQTTDYGQNFTLQQLNSPGDLKLGFMSATPAEGHGQLIRIPFQLLDDSASIEIREVVNSQEMERQTFTLSKTVSDTNPNTGLPLKNDLYSNYPNPFNPATNIKYEIKDTYSVVLEIFDLAGRKIKTLVNKSQQAGS